MTYSCSSSSRAALCRLAMEYCQPDICRLKLLLGRWCLQYITPSNRTKCRQRTCMRLRTVSASLELQTPGRAELHHLHVDPGDVHVWWLYPEDVRPNRLVCLNYLPPISQKMPLKQLLHFILALMGLFFVSFEALQLCNSWTSGKFLRLHIVWMKLMVLKRLAYSSPFYPSKNLRVVYFPDKCRSCNGVPEHQPLQWMCLKLLSCTT